MKLASIFNFLINRFSLRKNVSLIDKKNIQLKINKFLMFFKQQYPSCEQIIFLKAFLCPIRYLKSGFLYGCHECWPLAKNRNHARVL